MTLVEERPRGRGKENAGRTKCSKPISMSNTEPGASFPACDFGIPVLRNHRLGGGYNKAFGDILKREHLESSVIDSATRNQLFAIMDNRPAIEAALALLDPHERARLNHPSALMRFWKRTSTAQDSERKQRKSPAKQTDAELAGALHQVDQLTAHVAELEAARETTFPTELTYDAIVDWIIANVPVRTQRAVAAELTRHLKGTKDEPKHEAAAV